MRICFLGNDERLAYLRRHAFPGTEVDNMADFRGAHARPASVESRTDELELAHWYIERAVEAEARGFDAVITGCFGDPGVDAARELVSIPVIAPGETALLTARLLSHHFSIITPMASTLPIVREQVAKLGLQWSIASIVSLEAAIEEIRSSSGSLKARLVELCNRCIERDGAELIVLGCASMALLGDEVEEAISVPVVNAVKLSLKAAEMLVGAGLRHSKATFPYPPKMARVGSHE